MLILISPAKEINAAAKPQQRPTLFDQALAQINAEVEVLDDEQTYRAIEMYHGLQYRYLKEGLNAEDYAFLDEHLVILSAFYGIIRPNDGIKRYRKDFTAKGAYKAWDDKIYQALIERDTVFLNLASNEFSKVMKRYLEDSVTFIDVDFYECKTDGSLKQHSTISKKGRGQLVNYIARTRQFDIEHLKRFNDLGYRYDASMSQANKLVFIRTSDKG